MLTVNDLQRTYTGLLDDVMLRYSRDFSGERFFNKMIVKNILFGGGIYLNDGYLINHAVARRHLMQEESLLSLMISTNFIRILSREKNPDTFAEMPRKMADSGNESFKRLIRSRQWKGLRPIYESLGQSIFRNNNVRQWPAFDSSQGFTNLLDGTWNAKPADIGLSAIDADTWKRFRDAFLKLEPDKSNARHKYEVALKSVVGEANRIAMREGMDIANQAYHYNMGMMLTADPAEAAAVAVDTTVGKAFDELLHTREILQGQIDDLELINIPQELPLDDGALFVPFVKQFGKISAAKLEYLTAMQELLAANPKDLYILKKRMREATDQYIDRMQMAFALKLGRGTAASLMKNSGIRFQMASLRQPGQRARKSDIAATVAPTMGLAITLQSQAMNMKRHFLVERFRLVGEESAPRHADNVVTVRDLRPHIASLAFNPHTAREHVRRLRRFD